MAISRIGTAQGVDSATLPAHAVGDVAIVASYREGSDTAPDIPGDWTEILVSFGVGDLQGYRSGYKFLDADDVDTGTWTNAESVIVHVYRGVDALVPIGDANSQEGTGTTYVYGNLSLEVGDGTSWIVGFCGHRNAAANAGTPAEGVLLEDDVNAALRASSWDTNGGTSSGVIDDPDTGVASAERYTSAIELIAALGGSIPIALLDDGAKGAGIV